MAVETLNHDGEEVDGSLPATFAVGRYGEVIIAQGHGVRPRRWSGKADEKATLAGIDAPTVAPTITPHASKRYYVARCDVLKPGACYQAAPAITFVGGSPTRDAKAAAYLSQGSISEIKMLDGGKGYTIPPVISLATDTCGTGATFGATLDGTPPDPTSITQAEVVQGPPFEDEMEVIAEYRTQYHAWGPVEVDVSGTGGSVDTSFWLYSEACDGPGGPLFEGWLYVPQSLTYTVSGAGSGSGCKLKIGFYGHFFRTVTTEPCVVNYTYSWGVSGVHIVNAGSGYTRGSEATVTINPVVGGAGKAIIIKARTPENSNNTASPRFAVKSVAKIAGGSKYPNAPELKFKSTSGFGAFATCTVSGDAVDTVTLESGGGGYVVAPTVEAVSGGAEAYAVARPHLRGKYQCYYRYVDSTTEDFGGPIPSNMSPVTEVDTGEGTKSINWVCTAPDPDQRERRGLQIELWRSTANQATAIYRVATLPVDTFVVPEFGPPIEGGGWYMDDLTDEELRNPDRDGYAAMAVVMPNGDLSANRFGVPPDNKSVVVRFQDRFWYGVDTSGDEPNSIYFSNIDEPEAVPDINQFNIQQNVSDSDQITALIPFGSAMLVAQNRHLYTLSFAKKPLVDANVNLVAHRGCVNQKCWDIHAGACYAMDRTGIYVVESNGGVQPISDPIADLFRDEIDWLSPARFSVSVDPKTSVLRAWVTFKSDRTGPLEGPDTTQAPTRALCFSLDTKTWWIEKYPSPLMSPVKAVLAGGDHRSIILGKHPEHEAAAGIYMLDDRCTLDYAWRSLTYVEITEQGRGYKFPPRVTATSGDGFGAQFASSIDSEGRVTRIWILSPGFGYTGNVELTIEEPPPVPDGEPGAAPVAAAATAYRQTIWTHPTFFYKTGASAFPNDSQEKAAAAVNPRDILINYKPQPVECIVAMRLFYNNAKYARRNIAPRDRGTGFTHSTVDDGARLNMGRHASRFREDTGIAVAMYSGRGMDDISGNDRHIAAQLVGVRKGESVIFYDLVLRGTAG